MWKTHIILLQEGEIFQTKYFLVDSLFLSSIFFNEKILIPIDNILSFYIFVGHLKIFKTEQSYKQLISEFQLASSGLIGIDSDLS